MLNQARLGSLHLRQHALTGELEPIKRDAAIHRFLSVPKMGPVQIDPRQVPLPHNDR